MQEKAALEEQLNKEKRAYARLWKERVKQIERIIENTAGMYGDVRGLIGSAVPEIKALTLEGDEGVSGFAAVSCMIIRNV